jgi:endoglucanase
VLTAHRRGRNRTGGTLSLGQRGFAAFFALLLSCTALSALTTSALAGTANAGLSRSSNPLAGIQWGHYTGPIDSVYPAYAAAHGRDRRLLAKIALRPLAFWFGNWFADSYAKTVAEQYIASVTAGNPNVLAQVTVFRLVPWEGTACSQAPGRAAQASYEHWIDGFAAGIGSARVALVLQPDLPFALCSPDRAVPLQLVAYAARRFSALAHTTVYIDVGAAEWASPSQAASLLAQAGVDRARGFALNATQYGSTGLELEYGASVLHALGAEGIRRKHFVVSTAQNGAPFLAGQYHGNSNFPRVCASRADRICETLGIPPTWQTAAPQWGLSANDRSIAAHDADAYLWLGRPWLGNGGTAFVLSRALGLAASSPF